jgi:putative ABC transport system substrate-binding protein
VFTNVGDPLIAGLGDSFDNHMNHLTGISTLSDFEGMVKLVKEAIPGIKTIGTIYTPGEVNSVSYNDHLKIEAEKYGLKLISVPANSATEVADAALSIANQGIEAFTQISDNLTASCGASIIKTAYNSKIPYFAFISKQTDQGAIASIARDYYFAGVDAVNMAKEILEGTSPANIPFRYVTKSSLKVNTEAMEYFNIQLPEKYTQKE